MRNWKIAVLLAVVLLVGSGIGYLIRGANTQTTATSTVTHTATTTYYTEFITTTTTTITFTTITSTTIVGPPPAGNATNFLTVFVVSANLTHGSTPSGSITLANAGNSTIGIGGVVLTYSQGSCSVDVTGAPVNLTAGSITTLTVTAGTCSRPSAAGQGYTVQIYLSGLPEFTFYGVFS